MDGENKLYCISNGKVYLTPGSQTTCSLKAAGKWSHDKASNVLKAAQSANKFKWLGFQMVEADKQTETNPSTVINSKTPLIEKLKNLATNSEELKQYNDLLSEKHKHVEKEICDIYHYIEFTKFNAAQGYNACKMLKERLERRRQIKDEQSLINHFHSVGILDCNNNEINKACLELESREYHSRTLHELFEQQ
jgi:hypothetical protein